MELWKKVFKASSSLQFDCARFDRQTVRISSEMDMWSTYSLKAIDEVREPREIITIFLLNVHDFERMREGKIKWKREKEEGEREEN